MASARMLPILVPTPMMRCKSVLVFLMLSQNACFIFERMAHWHVRYVMKQSNQSRHL